MRWVRGTRDRRTIQILRFTHHCHWCFASSQTSARLMLLSRGTQWICCRALGVIGYDNLKICISLCKVLRGVAFTFPSPSPFPCSFPCLFPFPFTAPAPVPFSFLFSCLFLFSFQFGLLLMVVTVGCNCH